MTFGIEKSHGQCLTWVSVDMINNKQLIGQWLVS